MTSRKSVAERVSLLDRAVIRQIRIALAERDWNQIDLAGAVGENEKWISRRMLCQTSLSLNELDRIAGALGVTAADLLPREARPDTSVIQPYLRRPEGATEDCPDGRPAVSDAERRHGRRRPRRISVRPEVPCALPVAA
jgi:transcriptional regulator with XRE-family HTH domain